MVYTDDLFHGKYDRVKLSSILKDIFGDRMKRVERTLEYSHKSQQNIFMLRGASVISEVQLDDAIVPIIEIKQRSSGDPRMTITKQAFKLMQHTQISHAIIVFYSDDSDVWRFSFLTTRINLEEMKVEGNSPKRYSYLLGQGQKTKTFYDAFIKPGRGSIVTIKQLQDSFDVEPVRKEFFETYLELYVRLYKAITGDIELTQTLLSQDVDLVSFTKNLLGKIIFLYFIQQKGWLGLGRQETEYGKGDKNFMRRLWNNFKEQNESLSTEKTGFFYNDYLEWLFFAGLNIDRRDHDDRFPTLQMKVPYLNGGLFKEEYLGWESQVAKIDNDIFSNVHVKGDDADGILDIFDRYNFTVDEDSLLDSDVAVDPEMLGRIFEKMISISKDNIDEVITVYDAKGAKKKIDFGKELNKKLGAFYTPREIVHYMTKESLISYLVNQLDGDKESNEKLIRILFDIKEKFLLTKDDLVKGGFKEDIIDQLKPLILSINGSLKKVKILDPAVGSGAFPMGLLHEVSTLRYYIYGVFHDVFGDEIKGHLNKAGNLSMYQIKREIILNNIYGVDIDPGAIDIAKLRFWLSLIVEEETPEPLPNFEFKFVCANTLIPLEEETKQQDLFAQRDEPKLKTIKQYKKEYYNASSNEEKRELKHKIRNYTQVDTTLFSEPTPRAKQMAEFGANFDKPKHSHSFFDPSLMMSEWRGFDIVIGNPPYVSSWNMGDEFKNFYTKNYKTAVGHYDLYVLFFDKGLELLKKSGNINYITSNKFLSQKYGIELRKLFLRNSIKNIVNFNFDVFDNATVDTCIIIVEKQVGFNNTIKVNNINIKDDYEEFLKNRNYFIEQSFFNEIENNLFRLDLTLDDVGIIHKIQKDNVRLEDICYIDCGVVVHSEKLNKKKGDFIYNNNSEKLYHKYIEGKNIQRYSIFSDKKYIDYQPEFHHRPKFEELFENQKILVKDISGNTSKLVCALDDGSYVDQTIRIVVPLHLLNNVINRQLLSYIKNKDISYSNKFEIKYILSILLSSLIGYFFNKYLSDNLHISPHQLRTFPIKEIDLGQQAPFIDKVNKILAITKQMGHDPKNPPQEQLDLEKEIDYMVYELYGLTEEEINIVEQSLAKK